MKDVSTQANCYNKLPIAFWAKGICRSHPCNCAGVVAEGMSCKNLCLSSRCHVGKKKAHWWWLLCWMSGDCQTKTSSRSVVTLWACEHASAAFYHWAVLGFVLFFFGGDGRNRKLLLWPWLLWCLKLVSCSCYRRLLLLQSRYRDGPLGINLGNSGDMWSNLGDVCHLWWEGTPCWGAVGDAREDNLPGTGYSGTAGVSSSCKNVWFALAQDVWTLGCCLLFFLFVSGKFERSLLYSSVFALSALSFTCSEKVCDGSRRGGLPCAAAFANTQLL